jgi:haloacetate dehalogenase
LPERLLGAEPEAVVDNALAHWGSPAHVVNADVRAACIAVLRDPARAQSRRVATKSAVELIRMRTASNK